MTDIDILLAVVLALLAALTMWQGVGLTLRPPLEERKQGLEALFIIAGLASVFLIGVQAYRNVHAGDEVKALLQNQAQTLGELKEEGKRPIQVTVPPRKQASPQISNRKGDPAAEQRKRLKLEAVQLAAEILGFLGDRDRSGENVLHYRPLLVEGTSVKDIRSGWDNELKRYNDFRADTMTRYNAYFGERAVNLLVEMKVSGIDVQRAYYKPNTPETITQFTLDLAAVAARI